MADTYRPAEQRELHRATFRNPTWHRGNSQPQQTPTDPRSSAMASKPRPPADPRKRNSSRSPEGGHSRKQLKPNSPSVSRRPSTSNDSTRSPSTSIPPPPPPPPGGPDVASTTNDGVVDPQQTILQLLTNFSSQVASHAALQVAHDQAGVRYERAQLEYNEGRKQFEVFPAIKERKTAEKAAAFEDLQAKETKLNDRSASHAQVMAAVAQLIAHATAQRADTVSRADFIAVVNSRDELRKDMEAAKLSIKSLSDEIQELRKTANSASKTCNTIPNLQQHVEDLEKNLKLLTENEKKTANTTETVSKRVDVFMKGDLKSLASQEDVRSVDQKVDKLAQDIASMQEKHKDLMKDVGVLKADKIASGIAKSKTGVNDESREEVSRLLKEDVPALKREVEVLKEGQRTLATLTRGEELGNGEIKGPSLSEEIRALESRQEEMQRSIATMVGTGKDMLENRLMELEKVHIGIKDMTQNKSGDQITQKHNFKGLDNDQQGWNSTLASTSITRHSDRLDTIENEILGISKQAEEKDEIIISYIEKKLEPIEDRLTKLDTDHAELRNDMSTKAELERIEKRVSDAVQSTIDKLPEKSLGEFSKEMQNRLDTLENAIESGQNRLNTLNGLFQQLKAGMTSPNAAPAPVHLPVMSMLNGTGGSPTINGVHHSHNGGNTQAPMDYAAEINGLKVAHEAMVGTTKQLKQRYDNLTTDDLVRAMVDQMGGMYPDAKNFQSVITETVERDKLTLKELSQLREARDNMVKEMQQIHSTLNHLSNERTERQGEIQKIEKDVNDASIVANSIAGDAFEKAKEAKTSTDSLKAEINALKSDAKNMVEKIEKTTTNAKSDSPTKQLEDLRKDLTTVSEMAKAADVLSKGHASRFTKLGLEQMKTKQGEVIKRLDGHDEMVKKGEQGFSHVEKSIIELQTRVTDVEESIYVLKKRASEYEGDMDEFKEWSGFSGRGE